MKTWSTGAPNPRGDLYTDETALRRLEEDELELARKFVRREAPPEFVDDALEALGLTDAAQ